MPRQDDGVVVVRQHIFNFFAKSPARDRHYPAGEIVQPLFAEIGARDSAVPRHMEFEVLNALLKIPIEITATKCGIGLSESCF